MAIWSHIFCFLRCKNFDLVTDSGVMGVIFPDDPRHQKWHKLGFSAKKVIPFRVSVVETPSKLLILCACCWCGLPSVARPSILLSCSLVRVSGEGCGGAKWFPCFLFVSKYKESLRLLSNELEIGRPWGAKEQTRRRRSQGRALKAANSLHHGWRGDSLGRRRHRKVDPARRGICGVR